IPATRISKNSSKFELKIVRNLTRSISGCVGSCASSSTRRLNSNQLSSRLTKLRGSEKRFAPGTSLGRISTSAEASSATVAFAMAVGIYVPVDSAADKQSARRFKQSLLGKLGIGLINSTSGNGGCRFNFRARRAIVVAWSAMRSRLDESFMADTTRRRSDATG